MIAQDVFNVLSDRYSSNIFRAVYSGLKLSSTNYIGGLSKKQYYTRLKNLALLGLIEKRDSFYRTTTFGSIVYNSQIKPMDRVVDSYWKLKSVDVLSRREDFPSKQKDAIVTEILKSTGNYKAITGKHLTSIEIVKNFDNLINKVLNEPTDRIISQCRDDRCVKSEASFETSSNVIFTAALPHVEAARCMNTPISWIEPKHYFAEADNIPSTLFFWSDFQH